jgi:hypothetical protein
MLRCAKGTTFHVAQGQYPGRPKDYQTNRVKASNFSGFYATG